MKFLDWCLTDAPIFIGVFAFWSIVIFFVAIVFGSVFLVYNGFWQPVALAFVVLWYLVWRQYKGDVR